MAARIPRRSFASPFVVTLAACSGSPPPANPTPPSDPVIVANPPRPAPDPQPPTDPQPPPGGPKIDPIGNPPPKVDRHWRISMANNACTAFDADACQFPNRKPGEPIPPCNPPPPQKYAPCPPGLADGASLIVVQAANQPECVIQREPVKCPPVSVCNPPMPTRVACPK
jgi:hypothetical protein